MDPEENMVVIWMTQVSGNGMQSSDSKYANKGVPMRPMLQSIIYSAVVDGSLTSKQSFSSGTPEVEPLPKL